VNPPTGFFCHPFVTQFVTGKRKTAPRAAVRNAVSRCGGSAWESNPPKPPKAPSNGFEDRTGHQARSAPLSPSEQRRLSQPEHP